MITSVKHLVSNFPDACAKRLILNFPDGKIALNDVCVTFKKRGGICVITWKYSSSVCDQQKLDRIKYGQTVCGRPYKTYNEEDKNRRNTICFKYPLCDIIEFNNISCFTF